MSRLLLSASLLAISSGLAQAESLEIIELKPETIEQQSLSVNWDCDVLMLSTSQRYRPTACKSEQNDGDITELQVEKVSAEESSASRMKRKGLY